MSLDIIIKGYLLNKYLLLIETIKNTKAAFGIVSGLMGVGDLIRRVEADKDEKMKDHHVD